MPVTLPTKYKLTKGTTFSEDNGVVVDRTDDGATASRDLYPRSYFEINVEFLPLAVVEHAGLMSFLRANKTEEFDLTIDLETYRCRLTKAPSVKFLGGQFRQASCTFRGYAL